MQRIFAELLLSSLACRLVQADEQLSSGPDLTGI